MTAPDPSPDKPGCRDPALGRAASRALGQPLTGALRDHVAACLACQLERVAYRSLDRHATEPSPALSARIRLRCRALWREPT